METLNLKKDLRAYYSPKPGQFTLVQVPKFQFAMIDGAIEKGAEPGNSAGFQEATPALYGIAYTLKFMLKKRTVDPVDYPVMALEGLWWVEDGLFDISVKDNWFYTLMILQPAVITADLFEEARRQVRKKRGDSAALSRARLSTFEEGLCVQAMHTGPYSTEPDTIQRMRLFAAGQGYRDCVGPDGKHHEIYLGDPRSADPAKLRTVLRHPVEKIS
ncbi:MAG: GyrI-like domain-containing protein [Bacteroidota bacterium]